MRRLQITVFGKENATRGSKPSSVEPSGGASEGLPCGLLFPQGTTASLVKSPLWAGRRDAGAGDDGLGGGEELFIPAATSN